MWRGGGGLSPLRDCPIPGLQRACWSRWLLDVKDAEEKSLRLANPDDLRRLPFGADEENEVGLGQKGTLGPPTIFVQTVMSRVGSRGHQT